MNCSLLSSILAIAFLACLPAQSQTRHWVQVDDSIHVVGRQGGEIRLGLAVEEGYHIQSNTPDDPLLIPTELNFQWPLEIENDTALFPPSRPFPLVGTAEVLQVYDGNFHVRLPIAFRNEAGPGVHEVPGSLRYQACDERKCYYPRELAFVLRIRVQ